MIGYLQIPGPFGLLGRLVRAVLASPGARVLLAAALALVLVSVVLRIRAARTENTVRLQILPYRGEEPTVAAVVSLFDGLHGAVRVEGPRRLLRGQPSVALETAFLPTRAGTPEPRLTVVCREQNVEAVRSVFTASHPDAELRPLQGLVDAPYLLRMRKRKSFLKPLPIPEGPVFEEPRTERLIAAMQAAGRPVLVQHVITPASALTELWVRWRLSQRDKQRPRADAWSRDPRRPIPRSQVREQEVAMGLETIARSLFSLEVRVVAEDPQVCRRIAADVGSPRGANYLSAGLLGRPRRAGRRVRRTVAKGRAGAFPDLEHGLVTSPELAGVWQLPGAGAETLRLARGRVPRIPPRPGIARPTTGTGLLMTEQGPVTLHPEMRRQNTAVVGTVEQGKSSYLAATVAEDLRRDRCAVIVLDPKGDASDAALSLVPEDRTVTFLDFADPRCGFNPLLIDADPSAIADAVVESLKDVFDEGDIRASSDRYIRSAVTAVCIAEPKPELWHAARLLTPSQRSYRERVTATLRKRPEYREIAMFFAEELELQLRDARAMTVTKLEAPVNKLQRFVNPPGMKRILLNDTLRVDFDRIIREQEVLVVRGAQGKLGTGDTSALMQLLVGMLDAALSRQQDLVAAEDRMAVALKIDEAPQVINAGFAQTMAQKRSAGLETVACWQTDAQWTDPHIRAQLDALFAHRVLFASASVEDARSSADLLMGQYADTINPRPGARRAALVSPDVRTHLPRHTALVSWTAPEGRLPPFIGNTIPLRVDEDRIRFHREAQAARGGRQLAEEELLTRSLIEEEGTSEIPVPSTGPAGLPRPGGGAPPGEGSTAQLTLAFDAPDGIPGPAVSVPVPARPVAPLGEFKDGTVPASYEELVALEVCPTIRHPASIEPVRQHAPVPVELQLISLLAELRFMLVGQIGRRFFPGRERAMQRQLKKLVDAGWIQYLEFVPSGGGRGPRCYHATERGLAVLRRFRGTPDLHVPDDRVGAPEVGDVGGRLVRHDLRAAGWMLALQSHLGEGVRSLRGPRSALALPPRVTVGGGTKRFIGPAELKLEGEWYAADFLATDPRGRVRRNVERFEPLEPDGLVELRREIAGERSSLDLLIELDATDDPNKQIAKLERYDHFLTGWAFEKRRHQQQGQPPLVVFICRDEPLARRFCRAADVVLTAHRAEWGAPASAASYAGRERILFAVELDAHQGRLGAYRLPRLPPAARGGARPGGETPEQVEIFDSRLLVGG